MSDTTPQGAELSDTEISGDSLVDDVRRELADIDSTDIAEHAARFAALHAQLDNALRSIDNV